jgi:hypothetical protein
MSGGRRADVDIAARGDPKPAFEDAGGTEDMGDIDILDVGMLPA